jgi:small GTP-binding protein
MEPDNSGFIPLTIIFLGQSNTGKTSLIQKYKFGREFEFPIIHNYTLNFDIYNRAIFLEDDVKIKCEIWDTIGLECGKDLTLNNCNNTNGAVFVFDICNKESFENLNDYIIRYKKMCDNSNKAFFGLVFGNKSDKKNKREITYDEANIFSVKYGMKYYEVTAIKDRKSFAPIERAMEDFITLIIKSYKTKK